ncbi:hypothetical protein C7S20_04830 [Christiangramia fulva]|uniref:Alginate export domain-containing protein n=1 Tax=Christiangramia fulva TaxID=2126553 RepID=A0A2R3Z323_9FLAO|nr:alginate export family protein [Christiangramia fulva]AVR44639.1 hypothetical protein C7S20_04830 [Christiangramia fulva]
MKKIIFLAFFGMLSQLNFAQEFSADLQLRPRYEFRNGYKTLLNDAQEPANFVSQRSRLNLDFAEEKLKLKFSLQNIRVWGDVSTLNVSDKNGVQVFEAYGQYAFNDRWSFKAGRQVISYDNQRIFGEVDWAQQARSHDALVFSFKNAEKQQLDLGAAINAEGEDLVRKPYELNNYKNFQYAWYHLDFATSAISFLALNTGFEYMNALQQTHTDYLQTFGSYFSFKGTKIFGDLAAYAQTGQRNGLDAEAFYAGANLNYAFNSSWAAGLGAEYLSGKDSDDTSGKIKSFEPLFGTNHAFNGYMDYFYVGNHLNSVGLLDAYAKINFATDKWKFSALPHAFYAPAQLSDNNGNEMQNYLGTEIDLVAGYKLYKDLSLAFGYSQMFGTNSLEVLKGGDAGNVQNWSWLMLNFHPLLFHIK